MSLDTSEHLLLYMWMKTHASSTASAWRIKRCICPCEVYTKIACGGSNLQLSMYKLHKRVHELFSNLMATKFILTRATVNEHIEDKIFKILYIISHNIYNKRGTALSAFKIYTYLYKY